MKDETIELKEYSEEELEKLEKTIRYLNSREQLNRLAREMKKQKEANPQSE